MCTVKGFDLNSEVNISLNNNAVTQTVYVRSFYDRLLKAMLSTPRAVLIGNPGVSKHNLSFSQPGARPGGC